MTFTNAWHPVWTSTVQGGWSVVPGGWSIGVEFSFYLLFPIFAAWVTSIRRAVLVFVATVAIGVAANGAASALLGSSYQPAEVSNFLFFWFPNQASVFALGGVLYFILRAIEAERSPIRPVLRKHASLLAMASGGVFCLLAYVPLGHHLGAAPYVPASLAVCLPLMGLMIALSVSRGPLVHRALAAMGRVSFSAYLLHFAVLRLFEIFPATLYVHEAGYGAIFAFALGWLLSVALTYSVAWLTYRIIELPMMDVGKALIRARRQRGAAVQVGLP